MLGEGSFGKVFLVTLRSGSNKTPYALKMMNKKQLIQSRQVSADASVSGPNID